ncbi:MAG: HD domain-containing protein [Thermoanaerobaculia bacterium]|nr:HD domain-containing protein [Thermoanaerobaculia bacterium]
MHPEVDELRPKLKEILYDCAVDIRATKAALYLLDSSVKKFELVTEFGFRSAVRQAATFSDPLIDRCQRGRTPFFVNSIAADPRLSDLLFEGSTQRLLAVPLYSRGQLVGVIDMRDKAAQQPFEQPDLGKAQSIGDRMMSLFTAKNVFNQRFITISDVDEIAAPSRSGASAPAPAPVAQPAFPPAPSLIQPPLLPRETNDNRTTLVRPAPVVVDPAAITARISSVVTRARVAAMKIIVPTTPPSIGEPEMGVIREVLRSMLFLPNAVAAAVSATGTSGAMQEISARGTMAPEALDTLQSKLQMWLTKRGESTGPMRTSVQTPFGAGAGPVTPDQLHKVFTAPVVTGGLRGVYLTVAFSEAPDRNAHEMLTALLSQLQVGIEHSMSRTTVTNMRNRMAEELLEPQFTSFPDLRRHSESVAGRCEQFARFLGLSPEDIEVVRLTALVHDIGMRLLEYERLYKKRDVSADELSLLREHVTVGAAMVEPLLGVDIARGVLSHHERYDGRGYPNELQADEIPISARILALCDSYVAMTDPNTYQMPETHEDAMSAIARGAGGQYDPDLAARFAEFMAAGR